MTKAASPSSTFCDDLTITAVCSAVSPSSAPDATTAPVVSIVPPIQAPATSSTTFGSPSSAGRTSFASHGMTYIIGTAHTSTSEMM